MALIPLTKFKHPSKPSKHPPKTLKHVKPIQISSKPQKQSLKGYIQGYLAWILKENPSFVENLTNDEITNYFLTGIDHPEWFIESVKKERLKIISEICEYIYRYKADAKIFKIRDINVIEKGEVHAKQDNRK